MSQYEDDGEIEDNSDEYAEGEFQSDTERDLDFIEWEDNLGNYHELQYGDPPEDGEERTPFKTFEEAENYISKIMTDVAAYFDIYYYDGWYHVWWSGETD